MSNAKVIVVGGGLSGLSAAHTVLERGGNVVSSSCLVGPLNQGREERGAGKCLASSRRHASSPLSPY